MKLAIFVDQKFWFDGQVYSTDEAYILFPASFICAFDEVVFIGRLAPEPSRKSYVLEHPALKVCPLPYYESLYAIRKSGALLYQQVKEVICSEAQNWDAVLIGGPNPIGQYIASLCISLGRPVALLVRQNLIPQVRFANKGGRKVLGVAMAGLLEWQFRRLARGRTVFTVGQEMTKAYRLATPHVHNHFASLITEAQLADFSTMPTKAEPGRLLCVGRLSAEKGHRYLLAALAQLKSRCMNFSLDIVGSGPLEASLKAEADVLGIANEVRFHSYVPYGPELFAFYQRATALIVPSLHGEGFPQVINEALCIGVPTIASAVAGIPAFLTDGETAMLVPPANVSALATAIEQILNTPTLQDRLRGNGRALMRDHTLEASRNRMVHIIYNEVLEPVQKVAAGSGTIPPDVRLEENNGTKRVRYGRDECRRGVAGTSCTAQGSNGPDNQT